MSNWDQEQFLYWNSVADSYDSLYLSQWDYLENQAIQKKLSWLSEMARCQLLDLGSGTGLGYELCKNITELEYFGLDISPEMLKVARQKWPSVNFAQGCMHDLSMFSDSSFDAVISLFSAFSYENQTDMAIKEIYRVLKKEGQIFICVLGRWSLRRLLKFKFKQSEIYGTRGAKVSQSVPVNVFSTSQLKKVFFSNSFYEISVTGQGVFSGVLEHSRLWSLDEKLSQHLPSLAHMHILKAKK